MRRVLAGLVASSRCSSQRFGSAWRPPSSSRGRAGGAARTGAVRRAGYARDGGRDYRWILDHYYTGTTLGAAGVGRVRVPGAARSRVGRVTVGSGGHVHRHQRERSDVNLSAGARTIRANLQVGLRTGGCGRWWARCASTPGTAVLALRGRLSRKDPRACGGRLHVGRERRRAQQYVEGVVAWEMPADGVPRHSRHRRSSRARTGSSVGSPASGSTSRRHPQPGLRRDPRPRTLGRAPPWTRPVWRGRQVGGRAEVRRVPTRPPAGKPPTRGTSGAQAIPYLVGVEDAFDAIVAAPRLGIDGRRGRLPPTAAW